MKPRSIATIAVATLLGAGGQAVALPAFSTGRSTGAATTADSDRAVLVQVPSGRHPGFERVVFRFSRATPAWRVEYVAQPVRDGSGDPFSMLGARYLQIAMQPSRSPAFSFRWAHTPLFPTLRQVRSAGDFEGVVTMVAGLSKRAPFRVFRLSNPPRLVVDVRR